jgi:hypothetical protein
VLWFRDDGSLLSSAEVRRAVAAQSGQVYACRRSQHGGDVEVARVRFEEIESGSEPSYGTPW